MGVWNQPRHSSKDEWPTIHGIDIPWNATQQQQQHGTKS